MSKIILITAQKGGVGKSTLTFNLAQNIAANAKVAVLDFDLQGSLSQLKDMVTDFEIIPYQNKIEHIADLDFDFIFIDTPPYLSDQLPQLISIANLIIVPTKVGVLDLLSFKATLSVLQEAQKVDDTLVVFNMVKLNTTLTLDILIGLEEYNVRIASAHISDLVSFTRSVLFSGVRQDRNAQRQIDELTKEILLKLI